MLGAADDTIEVPGGFLVGSLNVSEANRRLLLDVDSLNSITITLEQQAAAAVENLKTKATVARVRAITINLHRHRRYSFILRIIPPSHRPSSPIINHSFSPAYDRRWKPLFLIWKARRLICKQQSTTCKPPNKILSLRNKQQTKRPVENPP